MSLEIPNHVAINFFKSHVNGIEMSGVHAARCLVCGDSHKHTHRKRLYLIHNSDKGWGLYCHNCGYSSSLLRFIKDYFPTQYEYVTNQCVKDFFFKAPTKTEALESKLGDMLKRVNIKKPEKKKKFPAEEYIENNCLKMTDDCGDPCCQKMINSYRQMLRGRLLDERLVDRTFYAYDGKYKQRIIIPFYNKTNEIYYFQAMGTQEWQKKNKYINFKHPSVKVRPEYNEDFVDHEDDVFLVEGLFDSTFLDNSVATLGVNLSSTRIRYYKKKYPKRIWVMDNDKVGLNATKKLLDQGERCVIFPKDYKSIKDLNDLALMTKQKDLTKKIDKYIYNSIEGLIEIYGR